MRAGELLSGRSANAGAGGNVHGHECACARSVRVHVGSERSPHQVLWAIHSPLSHGLHYRPVPMQPPHTNSSQIERIRVACASMAVASPRSAQESMTGSSENACGAARVKPKNLKVLSSPQINRATVRTRYHSASQCLQVWDPLQSLTSASGCGTGLWCRRGLSILDEAGRRRCGASAGGRSCYFGR